MIRCPICHVAATLFTNRLSNAIANVTLGQGPGNFPQVGFVTGRFQMRENLRAITSKGAELDARLGLGQWSVSASYAYTDARVHADGAAIGLDGLRPAQTAKNSASANARLAVSRRHRPVGDGALCRAAI